jgi:type 2 lantibiotic biosynthesis protein LanM
MRSTSWSRPAKNWQRMADREVLRTIVTKAISPDEWRELYPHARAEVKGRYNAAETLLKRWEQRITLNMEDPSFFDRRLEMLGLNRRSVIGRLATRSLPKNSLLPCWALFLQQVLSEKAFSSSAKAVSGLSELTEEERIYFALDVLPVPLLPEFLHPFVGVVKQRIDGALSKALPDKRALIAEAALVPVYRYLTVRLSRIAARTVAYEVKQQASRLMLRGQTSQKRYQFYVNDVLGSPEGLTELFVKYPVLARLLSVCSLGIKDSTVELLSRLNRDKKLIGAFFAAGRDPGPVVSILMGLSDPHQHGRTVCRIEFQSGLRIIYKPRSLDIDQALSAFVKWFNETSDGIKLKDIRVLPRRSYGWCDFIEERECKDRDQIKRFYQRQGAYLALFYFLCGRDFHAENFMASGEYPVPVDLEGILSPGEHEPAGVSSRMLPRYRSMGSLSLLSIGMLPYWRAGDSERISQVSSGINGMGDRPYAHKYPAWDGIGTDNLRLVYRYPERPESTNLPKLRGERIPVTSYMDDVLFGFKMAYRAVMQNRKSILSKDGALRSLRNVQSRCLIRSTYDYYELLFWSYAPDQLYSGSHYDVALEMLYRSNPQFGIGASFVDDEKASLWRGDIPVFHGSSNSRYLKGTDLMRRGPVFQRTSFAQMKDKIRKSIEEELAWQLGLIRASFQMSFEGHERGSRRESGSHTHRFAPRDRGRRAVEPFLRSALRIGDALERLAVRNREGAQWLDLKKPLSVRREISYSLTDFSLYAGVGGIGLFLANLASISGKNRYADLSREALDYAWNTWKWIAHQNLWDLVPIHGYTGTSSMIYALAECGRLLEQEALAERAVTVALETPLVRSSDQKNPDVLGGESGTLLSLLHLYDLCSEQSLLETANQLGRSILQCQEKDTNDGGWKSPLSKRPLLGMGHGAAGIAYAMARLYSATGDSSYRDAAESGLRYERNNFSDKHQDWPNLQGTSEEPIFMSGWCTGAAGTGLARLGVVDILKEDQEIETEIEIAVRATRRSFGKGGHHLCCGETGRVLFLLEAGRRLDCRELCEEALNAAIGITDFYERKGYLYLHSLSERLILPSLMSGISGIGLTFLALVRLDGVSKVLLLS